MKNSHNDDVLSKDTNLYISNKKTHLIEALVEPPILWSEKKSGRKNLFEFFKSIISSTQKLLIKSEEIIQSSQENTLSRDPEKERLKKISSFQAPLSLEALGKIHPPILKDKAEILDTVEKLRMDGNQQKLKMNNN